MSTVIQEALRALLERDRSSDNAAARPPMKGEVVAELAALEVPLRERGVKSLAIFGSMVHGTALPDSDVDVLVKIEPNVRFSLIDLVSLHEFLTERLGRRVDVVTRPGLDPGIRERVLAATERVF